MANKVGWNYLSIPKHCWSLGMDKWFHPTLYNGCNFLKMGHVFRVKLLHSRIHLPWSYTYQLAFLRNLPVCEETASKILMKVYTHGSLFMTSEAFFPASEKLCFISNSSCLVLLPMWLDLKNQNCSWIQILKVCLMEWWPIWILTKLKISNTDMTQSQHRS